MDKAEDHFFLHSLFDYHQRREAALGYATASDLLISIQSAIITDAGTSILTAFQALEEGADLYEKAISNQKKIERLTKKIRQSKSIKRQRIWYRIILRLHEESLRAELRTEEMIHGG